MIAWLRGIRPVRWWLIPLFFFAHLGFNAVFNFNGGINNAFASVYAATGGLINGTLLPNLIMIGVLIGGLCLGLGRLRPRDLGIDGRTLGVGVVLLVLTWGLLQIALGIITVASGEAVQINPRFAEFGLLAVIGSLLGQVLGNALFEEIAYRGFVFPQLYHLLPSKIQSSIRAALGLLLSLVLFGLIHLPARLSQGVELGSLVGSLAWTAVLGLFFAFFFLRTRTVWWAVAAHALGNVPTPLIAVADGIDPSLVVMLISLALLILSLVLPPFRRFVTNAPPAAAA